MTSPLATATGVAVILISYNRPQMLEHAWRSIQGLTPEDRIILVDDGSDTFDPVRWADAHQIDTRVFGFQRTLEARMYEPSLDILLNRAVLLSHKLGSRIITYLCDDDLFTPAWIPALRDALAAGPHHVVRARWNAFKDPLNGEPLAEAPKRTKKAMMDWRQMTTGNFAHRTECFTEEGLGWDETKVAVHDDAFLWRMHGIHPLNKIAVLPILAGWRREHAWNMAHYTQHGEYGIGADQILARGALE
jgi:glycosyltransferase involved in cell wall biosynthesis